MKISSLNISINKNTFHLVLILYFIITQIGCGGLRYSEISPDAKGFHPQRIGILPSDFGMYEEAKGVIDQIFMEVLVEKRWFKDVIAADKMANLIQSSDELKKLTVDYAVKLKTVNYSDGVLSRKIGNSLNIDAILMISVEYWNYTNEGDQKIAKVELGLKMIDAGTSKIIWRAAHHESEVYRLMKPKLTDVARNVAQKMIKEMPR